MGAILSVTDIEGDPVSNLNLVASAPTVQVENSAIRIIELPLGWSMFHINAPNTSIKGVNLQTGAVTTLANHQMDTILAATLHEYVSGNWVPISSMTDCITLVKNNAGLAYLPEFSFNGIGNVLDFQGYQVKTNKALRLAYVGDNHVINLSSSDQSTFPGIHNTLGGVVQLQTGFNMIGFPGVDTANGPGFMDIVQILEDNENGNNIIDKVIVFKNYQGMAILPAYDYYGFSSVSTYLGYQIKVSEPCFMIISSSVNYGIINFVQPPLDATDVDNGDNENNDEVDDQVVTDNTMTLTFLNNTIKELVTTPGFVGTYGNPDTFSNIWGLSIESALIEVGMIDKGFNNLIEASEFLDINFNGVPAFKLNVYEIFANEKLFALLSEIIFVVNEKAGLIQPSINEQSIPIEKVIESEKNGEKQAKASVLNDFTQTPGFSELQKSVDSNELFFFKSKQIHLQELFKIGVNDINGFYKLVLNKIERLKNLNKVIFHNRFLFYSDANLSSLKTSYGQSQKFNFNNDVSSKLFGDDALQAGSQGFSTNENINIVFNMTEGIDKLQIIHPTTGQIVGDFFMGKIRNVYKKINVDYEGSSSNNGKYVADTDQVVKNILSINNLNNG